MKKCLEEHSLTILLFTAFIVSWILQAVFQVYIDNDSWTTFFATTFENWESEFLQLFVFVTFTKYFREKGSPESK